MYIPPKCTQCGDPVSRISNVDSNLKCVNGNCKCTFEMVEKL